MQNNVFGTDDPISIPDFLAIQEEVAELLEIHESAAMWYVEAFMS